MVGRTGGRNIFGGAERVWCGLVRVVHLAALFLFSAQRKENISPTGATEEPLDSGNDRMFGTCVLQRV